MWIPGSTLSNSRCAESGLESNSGAERFTWRAFHERKLAAQEQVILAAMEPVER